MHPVRVILILKQALPLYENCTTFEIDVYQITSYFYSQRGKENAISKLEARTLYPLALLILIQSELEGA